MTDALRLLFIEDSEIDAELALRAMKRDGLEIEWQRVELEQDLRRALVELKPEIVLSDFSMPAFSGSRALQVVKEISPGTPFIFLSGTIGEERAIEAIRQGATDYVLKDNMQRLVTVVRRARAEAVGRERNRLAEAERSRLVQILEATSDLVGMCDPDGAIMYLNAAGRRLTGASGPEPSGGRMSELHPPWVRDLIDREGRPTAARDGLWHAETALTGADGAEIPVSQLIIAHRGEDGEVSFFSTIARDIRERRAYEARIQYLANYDALTRLPNRALLGDRAAQAITHARRFGRPAALLLLNLDRFKLINGSIGHRAGDELLCMVAERLRAAVRDGDTVARLGTDTFAVLAADLARPDDALPVARKIRDALHMPFSPGGHELHISASVGASTYPRDGEEFDLLLRNADAAMNRVKAEGGNGFQFYAAVMTREAQDRVDLENELRAALARSELEPHFQPLVELQTGKIIGVELLMRWHHLERGWIPPDRFVPIAEDSELIHPLGDFALGRGCRQVRDWDRAGLVPLRMSVNVSARQFRSPGFAESVARALRLADIDPSRLELELTETVLMENQDEAVTLLKGLKSLGISVAVDDFGTGYSSLSYLSRLPIDCLKIDRSFVQRVAEPGHDATIAQAVITLAHALGLRVVAEGVETAEQLEFLRDHGCDEGQGYLLSRPVLPHSIAALLDGALNTKPRESSPS